MTAAQKENVARLREQGESYRQIAKIMNLSENTIKSYFRRKQPKASADVCLKCRTPLEHIQGKKPKKFCSDKCRMAWWRSNSDALNRKAMYSFVCAHCGVDFQAYGNAKRKFCSTKCFGQALAGRWRDA